MNNNIFDFFEEFNVDWGLGIGDWGLGPNPQSPFIFIISYYYFYYN